MFLLSSKKRGFLQKIFDLGGAASLALMLCHCTSETEDQAVSSRVARVASPTPAATSQKTNLTNEPCAVFPVESGGAIVDSVTTDILRLRLINIAGQPASSGYAALLEFTPAHNATKSATKVAFYRLPAELPEGLYAKLPEPLSVNTSASLTLFSFNENRVASHVLSLRCPAEMDSSDATFAVREVLASPSVHVNASNQFLGALENLVADGPAEQIPHVLALLNCYLENSISLAGSEAAPVFSRGADIVSQLRKRLQSGGEFAERDLEELRQFFSDARNKLKN